MRLFIVLCALITLVISPSVAQEEPLPDSRPGLLRVLSAAPDIADIRTAPFIASYVDYQAVFAARGFDIPVDSATFMAMSSDSKRSIALALPQAGSDKFVKSFNVLDEMPAVTGFDFFQIGRAVEVGTPPANAVVLEGEFDTQAVIDAHLARDYTVALSDDFGTTLCPADGCDSGMQMDLNNRNPANPFGGDLGQSQPLIVSDSLILNTRTYPLLVTMSGAVQGRTTSLAEAKDVQAVANILAYRQYVSAVVLISPAATSVIDATASSGRFSNFMRQLDSLPALPMYSLMSVSFTSDGGYDYGDVLLIYPDIDSASRAYESIVARLEVIESVRVEGRTVEQLFSESGEFLLPQVVTDEKTNFSAVQLTIRAAQDPEVGAAQSPFGRLITMVTQRDTVLFLPTE